MAKRYLVVVDMQNDFITGALGSVAAQKIVDKVCDKIRNWDDGMIVYTMDTHFDQYYSESIEGQDLPIPHCIFNTEGWQLNSAVRDAITERAGAPFDYKNTAYGKACFGCGILADDIRDEAVDLHEHGEELYVELVGLCTDVCVISNAIMIRNQMPNIRVVVDASCCAGTTRRNHQLALNAMMNCGIQVINNTEEE